MKQNNKKKQRFLIVHFHRVPFEYNNYYNSAGRHYFIAS